MRNLLFLAVFVPSVALGNVQIFLADIGPDSSFVAGDSIYFDINFSYTSPYNDKIIIGIHGLNQNQYYEFINSSVADVINNYPLQHDSNSMGFYRLGFKIPETMLGDTYHLEVPYLATANVPEFPIAAATNTSVIDPVNPPLTIRIKYYSLDGIEIAMPSSGPFIWQASNGQSGKTYILN